MVNYKNGKIYTIKSKTDPNLIYVGSTTQTLNNRWKGHVSSSLNDLNREYILYKTLRENLEDFSIELYELYPCDSKKELFRREGEVIREIGTLNSRIEGRTKKEWTEQNIEKIKKQLKNYREQNKDKMHEYQKEYSKSHIEEKKQNDKEYRLKNIEKIKQQRKVYYQNNKEVISQMSGQMYTCECGRTCRIGDKSRHFKTEIHKKYLSQL